MSFGPPSLRKPTPPRWTSVRQRVVTLQLNDATVGDLRGFVAELDRLLVDDSEELDQEEGPQDDGPVLRISIDNTQ